MEDELDLDQLIALQEQEQEQQRIEEDEDEDLEVLRDWEAEQEAKENKFKKALFQGQENKERTAERLAEPLKRPHDGGADTSMQLEELPDDNDDDVENLDPGHKSPQAKKFRSDAAPQAAPQQQPLSQNVLSILRDSHARKIFRRIPEGDFQPVTMSGGGERFYLRRSEEGEEDKDGELLQHSSKGGGLCGVAYSTLLDQALHEQSKMRAEVASEEGDDNAEEDSGLDSMSSSDEDQASLWVEKFRPRSFLQLLSDDGTNRMLLHWLKLWDKVVFNRDRKPARAKPPPGSAAAEEPAKRFKRQHQQHAPKAPKAPGAPAAAELVAPPDELDASHRPLQRVALLHGPPGLGKTTLAHVIATHAGYNVVEMNASDDRALASFKARLDAATQMRSVSSRDQRPNCLVIDEIDGAPAPTINYLVGVITGKKGGKTKKKSADVMLQRPIICICNDLYVPALRPLKQHCLVLPFPPTLPVRLSQRLADISRKEGLRTDLTALLALCEKTGNDIRACLSTLQFFRSRGKRLGVSDVQRTSIGQKDSHKSHFAVWKQLFEMPKGTKKRYQEVGGKVVVTEENSSSVPARYSSMLGTVYACGDYDKLLQGVFENYLQAKFKDSQLFNVTHGHEWFCMFDLIQQQIAHTQIYATMAYMPFTFVTSHLVFAAHSTTMLSYPHSQAEKNNLLTRNKNLISSMISEMAPKDRSFVSATSLVFDILPNLLEIIQPNMRPVNTQLYSTKEKEELKNLVAIMRAYNLSYQQERTQDGQFVYTMDPSVDAIGHFPDTKHRPLTYATKQLIAHEIELEKLRRETSTGGQVVERRGGESSTLTRMTTPHVIAAAERTTRQQQQDTTSSSSSSPPIPVEATSCQAVSAAAAAPSHLQKLQAKAINVKERNPVDFFGRKIDCSNSSSSSKVGCDKGPGGKDQVMEIVSSDIWFKFKEGYNNAVRRNIKMKDLC